MLSPSGMACPSSSTHSGGSGCIATRHVPPHLLQACAGIARGGRQGEVSKWGRERRKKQGSEKGRIRHRVIEEERGGRERLWDGKLRTCYGDIVIVSQTLLQEGGRHAAHNYTVSQLFFFPIAMPNSILKVITQRYICWPLAVEFCWHSDLAAVQEVGFVALQTSSQTHVGHWCQELLPGNRKYNSIQCIRHSLFKSYELLNLKQVLWGLTV